MSDNVYTVKKPTIPDLTHPKICLRCRGPIVPTKWIGEKDGQLYDMVDHKCSLCGYLEEFTATLAVVP